MTGVRADESRSDLVVVHIPIPADVRFAVACSFVRMLAAVVLFTTLSVSTACTGGGNNPQVLPSLTPTSAPTTGPSSVPVAIPPAATVHSPSGAAAFVRFFYERLNAALNTADPRELEALTDPRCGTCKNYLASIRQLSTAGERILGTSVRVLSAEAPPESAGLVAVLIQIDAPARSVVDGSGQVIRSLSPVAAAVKTVYVERSEERWAVRAVKDPS